MKYALRISLIVLLACIGIDSFAQKVNYDGDFAKIDSLAAIQQARPALALINQVNLKARKAGNTNIIIKSVMYRRLFKAYLDGNDLITQINLLRQDVSEAKQPEKSILQSLLAETFWNYYSQHSYKISQRTNVADDIGNDIATWPIKKLLNEVTRLYLASISEVSLLQNTSISTLEEILIGDKATRYLQPTLYDLLANNALVIFRNTQLNQQNSADSTTIDLKEKSRAIFNNLLTYHLKHNNTAAYSDTELTRLRFFKSLNGSTDDNLAYFNSLQKLLTQSEGTEINANVLYELAVLYRDGKVKVKSTENNLKIAVELAQRAVDTFPKSSGGSYAQNLIEGIKALSANILVRGSNLPGQPIDALYTLTNIDSLYLGLYKITLNEAQDLNPSEPDKYYRFLNRKPIKSWVRIPQSTNDYRPHEIIDRIDGLPIGDYIVIAQNRPILDTLNQRLINRVVHFKVSGIVVTSRKIANGVTEFKVLEAKDGLPIKGARIQEDLQRANQTFSNSEGVSKLKNTIGKFKFAIVSVGEDSVLVGSDGYYYGRTEEEEIKVLFFTDRPIYRPGQEVFYKGLILKEKLGSSTIVPGYSLAVSFMDVNNTEIRKLDQTSNEYGSFSGSFTIPNGKLNGRMEISTDFGEVEIRVEEYKRPTFEVTFPRSKEEYLFNDSVRVEGKAMTYSGYPIANAQVTYTINDDSGVFLTGTIQTNEEGLFKLSFFSPKKDKLKPYNNHYNVRAEVTSPAGETRTANKDLYLNERGLNISFNDYGEDVFIRKQQEVSFRVSTRTYNDVKAKVKIEWFILQPPKGLARRSLNPNADSTLYKEKWKATKIPLEQSLVTDDGNVQFNLKEGELNPGYYRIKVTAKSDNLDTGSYSRIYRIYDSQPDSILFRSEWAMLERRTIDAGEDAVFRLAGFRNKSNVFYEVSANNKILKSGWLEVSPLQTIFRLPILKSYGENVQVDFMMVQDGEWHSKQSKIYIIDPATQLDFKFLSFRDKLQPGEKETWKLRIMNKLGERRQVELLATLYDASLDALVDNNYGFWQHYPGRYGSDYPNWTSNLNLYGSQNSIYFLNRDTRTSVFSRMYEKLNAYNYDYYNSPNISFSNFLKNTDVDYYKRRQSIANERLNKLGGPQKIYGLIKDPDGYGVSDVEIVLNNTRLKPSDAYGIYVIDAKIGDKITFSSLGFITYAITVKSLGRFDVYLKEERRNLNEVVIRGYSSRTRESTTGSSFIVSGREVQDVPVGRVEQLLQGKVAGLNIQNNRRAYQNEVDPGDPGSLGNIIPRTNFSETAFFYPQLRSDAKGEFNIEFTIPQSLTRYKMMGFAHTKAYETLLFSRQLVTQKQFAITANAPRFFRQADTILLSATLNNVTGKVLNGKAYLELRNALTDSILHLSPVKNSATQEFQLKENGNTVISWLLVIPAGVDAITYKVVAESGKYIDGEENTISVLSNSILVTEAIPLNIRGNTSKAFTMDKLIKSGSSSTLRHQSLTLEFTANPVWTAIQALPYLMEYPYECAEQTMSRFYANTFAVGIVNSSPQIKAVFEAWQKTPDHSFASNLNRNSELKSLLLAETPWVQNAGSEAEKKKRLATLFDLDRMSGELKDSFDKLVNLQNANGSFSWFKGMQGDRFITQHIVLNMSQLKYLKLINDKAYSTYNTVMNKAILYLDGLLVKDFETTLNLPNKYATPMHYLYARSYSTQINENKSYQAALNKALNTISIDWPKMDTYQQGLAALVLLRNAKKPMAQKIINALKDRAQHSEEMGMYWSDNKVGWWWYQSPVETQALLIELFEEAGQPATLIEEMKIWLLKNKQTNNWKTTKATTAACYALLMRGYNLLEGAAEPEITLGGKTTLQLGIPEPTKEAGTGYRKIKIEAANIKPEMGTVVVKNNNQGIAWGGLYWQYFEQIDKINAGGNGITIKKELYLQTTTTSGAVLNKISSSTPLKKGDLIKVRMEIRCDRQMEYMHLKDMRSAGFEPVNVLSGYRYQDGLGYYESTKDASTNFFIDHMPKGVYIFEYPLRVTHSGSFSNGITTLQSMYAPEFTTYSEGIRVLVK